MFDFKIPKTDKRDFFNELAGRPRELLVCGPDLLLISDSGGAPIENFDDGFAVLYFLRWLRQRRIQRRIEGRALSALPPKGNPPASKPGYKPVSGAAGMVGTASTIHRL